MKRPTNKLSRGLLFNPKEYRQSTNGRAQVRVLLDAEAVVDLNRHSVQKRLQRCDLIGQIVDEWLAAHSDELPKDPVVSSSDPAVVYTVGATTNVNLHLYVA